MITAAKAIFVGIAAGSLLLTTPAHSQIGQGAPLGINATMIRMFGDIKAFSADADVRMVENGSKKESLRMPMRFVFLDGKIRAEIDINKVQSTELQPENLATFKKMGMDQLTSIVRPESNSVITVYPRLRAYTTAPMATEDRPEAVRNLKLERVKLRTETVDGHPTEVFRVTVSAPTGAKQEALVWNATDFHNFPIRIQLNQPEAQVTMQYRDIQLRAPGAAEFEPPAGFASYDSIEKLMMAAASRMTGTLKPPGQK